MTGHKILVSIFLILFSFNFQAFAQNEEPIKYASTYKSKFFISWGGNRDTYTKSDIRFEGEG